MSELPFGWASCSVGELIERIETGKSVKCDERPPIGPEKGLVKISAVTWGKFDEKESKTLLDDTHLKPNEKIQQGDFLISRANTLELVGSCVLVKSISKNLYLSDKVLRLVLADETKPWLLACLKTHEGRRQIESLATGNQLSMRNISQQAIRDIKIPLPPLPEQTRIAQKIEELLAKVDPLKAHIDAIPALLKRFRQSVLASATSGRLTEEWRAHRISGAITTEQAYEDGGLPLDWKVRPLKKLVTKIEQGWSPKCESVSASDDEWAVIKTTAIQPITFGPLENKKLPTTLLPRPELTIVIGDILITRAGPRSRAAVCCYVRATQPKLMVCDKAYRFRTIEEEFSGLLMCYFLNAPQFVRALDDLKTGISESGLNLTMKKFQDLELPQPPIEEQIEIVRQIEQLFAFANQLEAKVASAKGRIDLLTQSILAKAFRGELVLQDPNDEPARVLLERIKAQRAAAPKPKRSRKASA
ncbi:hypothetical protein EAH72_01395 [Pseudomonas caspiana]|nr:restriction endonuclease subunit S [Pseudomonas caspiana]TPG99007.1 hypothetical protein EAH72_01395 [Pseudomonas caspiana]